MAKLHAKARNALSSGSFALPKERKFPIEDKNHARNAFSRASAQGPEVKAKVDAAVHRKFPGIGRKPIHAAGGISDTSPPPGPDQTITSGTWTPPNSSGNGGQNQDLRAKMKAMGYKRGTAEVKRYANGIAIVPAAQFPARMGPSQQPRHMAGGASRIEPDSGGMNSFRDGKDRVPGKVTRRPKDTVPAMLSPGEAVLNRAAAERMGRGKISALNEHGRKEMGMRGSHAQRVPAAEERGMRRDGASAGGAGPARQALSDNPPRRTMPGYAGGTSSVDCSSGMERSMHALADKEHPVRRR